MAKNKEKSNIESFLIPPRKPSEYGDYSKYHKDNQKDKDPIRINFDSSLAIRHRLAYSYTEYVTHTVLHRVSTIQWLPNHHSDDQSTYNQFLFGTNDYDPEEYNYERNCLYIFGFISPEEGVNGKIEKCRVHKYDMKGFAPFKSPTVIKKIFVKDGIKLARYMPQNPSFVSTIGVASPMVSIFDTAKHPKLPRATKAKPKPNVSLGSQTSSNVSNFAWNPSKFGSIAGGCQDGSVNVWDINSKKIQNDKETKPMVSFYAFPEEEEKGISGVEFHPFMGDILAASSVEGSLGFFDLRQFQESTLMSPIHAFKPDDTPLTSFSLSPLHQHLFATGSQDKVKLWDLRHTKRELFVFPMADPVTQVQFSPHAGHMLAASTTDPSIVLLNANKAGMIPPPDRHVEDGFAEVAFVHFQREQITDFSWGPKENPWRMASVDNSFAFTLWTPSYKMVYENI